MEDVIKGELTPEEVEKLKSAYPGLKVAEFQHHETDEKAVVYLKKMDRQQFIMADKFANKDLLTYGEYILKNLQIAGFDKEEIIKDLDWLKNFSQTVLPMVFVKAGILKKN